MKPTYEELEAKCAALASRGSDASTSNAANI